MYVKKAATQKDWELSKKIILNDIKPTMHFGKGITVQDPLPSLVHGTFEDFKEEVQSVYFAIEDAGNFEMRGRVFRECLPFDSTDYTVHRMMYSTNAGYVVYAILWIYYYGDDECGGSSLDVYITRENEPNEVLKLEEDAHLGLREPISV